MISRPTPRGTAERRGMPLRPLRPAQRVALVALAVLFTGAFAHAETTLYPHVALYWLEWIADGLAFVAEEADHPAPALPGESGELLLVRQELAELREEMAALRATMDDYLGGLIASMQQENQMLRRDLDRANRLGVPVDIAPAPQVPRPEGAYVPTEPLPPLPSPAPPAPAGPPSYEIVKEWGRTPDLAAELGADVAALKGMVLVIPAGTPSTAIEELGRSLRDEFDAYENINIEVFDDADAAAEYVDHPTARPARRVLSVSRQASAGLDTILITENGITMDIAR